MTKLFKFQRIGVKKLHRLKGRTLLADEMGLGKTLQSLTYANEAEDTHPILVICPAFLKRNWEHEASIHLGLQAQVIEGTKVPKRMPLLHSQLVIINYDILKFWYEYIRELKPKLIIIDETHFIKNRAAKRTKYCKMLCHKVKKVIGLSGTPLEIRPIELFPILNILWPKEFSSYWAFGMRYCKPRRRPWGIEFRGATHIEELHEHLKELGMIRRRKQDVLKDLPAKINTVVPMDLPNMAEYNMAEKRFREWLQKERKSGAAIRRALRAEAVVQMGYLKRLAAKLKLEIIMQWIDNFLKSSPNGKLLMFGVHRSILATLQDKYSNVAVLVNGKTPKRLRPIYHDLFRKSKKCRILFNQLSMAAGWNAKGCSTVGFAELGWKPAEHNQAADRVHGIGRGVKGVTASIYYFVAKNTIEERLCKLLQEHQKTIDAVLDGGPVTDFDLIDQLLRIYSKAA